jgi:hypothetical protein
VAPVTMRCMAQARIFYPGFCPMRRS